VPKINTKRLAVVTVGEVLDKLCLDFGGRVYLQGYAVRFLMLAGGQNALFRFDRIITLRSRGLFGVQG